MLLTFETLIFPRSSLREITGPATLDEEGFNDEDDAITDEEISEEDELKVEKELELARELKLIKELEFARELLAGLELAMLEVFVCNELEELMF